MPIVVNGNRLSASMRETKLAQIKYKSLIKRLLWISAICPIKAVSMLYKYVAFSYFAMETYEFVARDIGIRRTIYRFWITSMTWFWNSGKSDDSVRFSFPITSSCFNNLEMVHIWPRKICQRRLGYEKIWFCFFFRFLFSIRLRHQTHVPTGIIMIDWKDELGWFNHSCVDIIFTSTCE